MSATTACVEKDVARDMNAIDLVLTYIKRRDALHYNGKIRAAKLLEM